MTFNVFQKLPNGDWGLHDTFTGTLDDAKAKLAELGTGYSIEYQEGGSTVVVA